MAQETKQRVTVPDDKEQVAKVAHRAEADKWVDAAEREAVNEERDPQIAMAFASVAQVHASLAITEQLERLNEMLGGADLDGRLSGFLDNLTSQISEIVWRNTGGGK